MTLFCNLVPRNHREHVLLQHEAPFVVFAGSKTREGSQKKKTKTCSRRGDGREHELVGIRYLCCINEFHDDLFGNGAVLAEISSRGAIVFEEKEGLTESVQHWGQGKGGYEV